MLYGHKKTRINIDLKEIYKKSKEKGKNERKQQRTCNYYNIRQKQIDNY